MFGPYSFRSSLRFAVLIHCFADKATSHSLRSRIYSLCACCNHSLLTSRRRNWKLRQLRWAFAKIVVYKNLLYFQGCFGENNSQLGNIYNDRKGVNDIILPNLTCFIAFFVNSHFLYYFICIFGVQYWYMLMVLVLFTSKRNYMEKIK